MYKFRPFGSHLNTSNDEYLQKISDALTLPLTYKIMKMSEQELKEKLWFSGITTNWLDCGNDRTLKNFGQNLGETLQNFWGNKNG